MFDRFHAVFERAKIFYSSLLDAACAIGAHKEDKQSYQDSAAESLPSYLFQLPAKGSYISLRKKQDIEDPMPAGTRGHNNHHVTLDSNINVATLLPKHLHRLDRLEQSPLSLCDQSLVLRIFYAEHVGTHGVKRHSCFVSFRRWVFYQSKLATEVLACLKYGVLESVLESAWGAASWQMNQAEDHDHSQTNLHHDLEPVYDLEPMYYLEPMYDLEPVGDLEPMGDPEPVGHCEPKLHILN